MAPVVKNWPAKAGDTDVGSIPGLGRSPGIGNGNLLQYSCLEDSMDRGPWQATVHGATKSQTWLSDWAHMNIWCFWVHITLFSVLSIALTFISKEIWSVSLDFNGNLLQYSCLENPMDGGAWQATVHRVAKSWTGLSDFTLCSKLQTWVYSVGALWRGHIEPSHWLSMTQSKRHLGMKVLRAACGRTRLEQRECTDTGATHVLHPGEELRAAPTERGWPTARHRMELAQLLADGSQRQPDLGRGPHSAEQRPTAGRERGHRCPELTRENLTGTSR